MTIIKQIRENKDISYLIGLVFLNIESGIIFSLVSFIIPYHLCKCGHSAGNIGLMFLSTLPYTLKIIWGPLIDVYTIPWISRMLGKYRGWMFITQLLLTISCSSLLFIDPTSNLKFTAIILFAISLSASIHDIVLDSYRIARSKINDDLTLSTTLSSTAFRIGIAISCIGILYISEIFNWEVAYLFVNLILLINIIFIFYIKDHIEMSKVNMSYKDYFVTIKNSVRSLKQHHAQWKAVLLFIIFYKGACTIPTVMSIAFFIDLSYSSIEIANVNNAYGLIVTIVGGSLGGIISHKLGKHKSLLICGCIQLLGPIMFIILAQNEHNLTLFTLAITVQKMGSAVGGVALMIYLGSLCESKYVATQFALIISFSSLVRISLSSLSGVIAEYLTWGQFFIIATLFSMSFLLFYKRIK